MDCFRGRALLSLEERGFGSHWGFFSYLWSCMKVVGERGRR